MGGRWRRGWGVGGRRASEAQAGEARWPGGNSEPRPREVAARSHAAPVGVSAPDHACHERAGIQRRRRGGARAGGGTRMSGRARKRALTPPPRPRPATAWLCVRAVSEKVV